MPADKASNDPIFYSNLQGVGIFRIDGRGSMNNVHLFMGICGEVIKAGNKRIVVDLVNCIGLDSTFMGSLVEIDDKMKSIKGELILIQVNDKVKDLLTMLGVLEIVKIGNKLALPENLLFEKISSYCVSDVERIKLIHQAHKKLVESNPKNLSQFGNFLKALEAELKDM
jgi:anti-anti-sigma factor